jgi:hypothetical protein
MESRTRRLARHIFTAFALLSLTVATVAFGFWLCRWATPVGDEWVWQRHWRENATGWRLYSSCSVIVIHGWLQVGRFASVYPHDGPVSWQKNGYVHEPIEGAVDFRPPRWGGPGGVYVDTAGFIASSFAGSVGAQLCRVWTVRIPLWFVALICCVVPAIWEWHYRVGLSRLFRVRRGLCAVCGYDLRASSGRCPECGAEIGAGTSRSIKIPTAPLDLAQDR